MATRIGMTAAEFLQMPAENDRFELVRGEIVQMNRPGMQHGLVCKNVIFILESWAREHSKGYVFANDTGVVTERDPDSVRGPDCMFVRSERMPSGESREGWLEIAPDLAVEVRSPTDRWSDIINKVGEYLAAGVLEVWVLNPDDRSLHVFCPDASPNRLDSESELRSESVLPNFYCLVADFFVDV
jgi:Uma2 family endonuclease